MDDAKAKGRGLSIETPHGDVIWNKMEVKMILPLLSDTIHNLFRLANKVFFPKCERNVWSRRKFSSQKKNRRVMWIMGKKERRKNIVVVVGKSSILLV